MRNILILFILLITSNVYAATHGVVPRADGQGSIGTALKYWDTSYIEDMTADTATVNDDAYDATSWNGNNNVPTKNALRDKIETIGAGAGTVTSIGTNNGLTGGTITATGVISGVDSIADSMTKGVASFNSSDFNSSSGIISTDYTNGQAATGSLKGFLTAADWTTFNSKGTGTVSTGTARALSYYPSTGTTIDDAANLFTTGTNIGIGLSAPLARLHISGTGSSSASLALLVGASTTTSKLVVTNAGKVGVGLSNPAYTLDVAGDINLSGTIYTPFYVGLATSNGSTVVTDNGSGYNSFYGSNGQIFNAFYGLGHGSDTFHQVAQIDGNGITSLKGGYFAESVGIGNTAPTQKLDVTGSIKASVNISTADGAYATTWNGNNNVPTKNAVYDKIETLSGGGGSGTVNAGAVNAVAYYASAGTTLDGAANLFTDGTYVGIGTSTPNDQLSIVSPSTTNVQVSNFLAPDLLAGNVVEMGFGKSINTYESGTIGYYYGSGPDGFIYISNYGDSGNTGAGLVVKSGGYVGIGNSTPGQMLDVTGNIHAGGDVSTTDEAYDVTWDGSNNVPTKNAVYDKIETLGGGGGGSGTVNSGTARALAYYPSSSTTVDDAANIFTDGTNIGIGNTAPSAKLDVSGTVKSTGFKMTTSPTTGYFLMSDSGGVGTWNPISNSSFNTSTVVTNWPDTIVCNDGSNNLAMFRPINTPYVGDGKYYYRYDGGNTTDALIAYNSDGTYSSSSGGIIGSTGGDCVSSTKSIATLYSDREAFNFVGGSTGWSVGSGKVYTTSLSDKVGIGTTAPVVSLDVQGSATFTGTIRSTRTTDLGWGVVSGANTACNTTCTNACVMGFDQGTLGVALGSITACTDATADECLCAGSN